MENFRNKIIFIIFSLVLLSALVGAMVFLVNKSKKNPAVTTKIDFSSTTESKPEAERPAALPEKESPQAMTMDTDYFTLNLPPAWEKSSKDDILPLTIVDTGRETTNAKAKEIDFKTNLSIDSTSLGDTSLKDYIESVKASLVQSISVINIVKEEAAQINGKDAFLLEIESTQQDLNFHTLLAFITGKDSTVWAFSYNTLEESWPVYENIFNQMIESIKMK